MGPPPEEELTRLERHFYRNARKGIVLNKRELRSYCDRYGIEADDSQLTSLKRKWVFSAIFTRPRGVSAHMGMMLPRYGSTMIDLAQMGTRKTRVGGRAPPSAFLLMVECVSSKIGCFPVRDKTASSWEDGVRRMLEENTDEITVLVSDRDSAVVGNAFRKRMKEKYGIDWCFLKSRSKAFLAETYIGHVKTALSVAMAANPKEKDWSKFLPAVVERFNDKLSPGTRMKRKSINKGNYLEALAQRYKVGDPEASFHGTHVSGESISPKRAKLLWKYAVGTRVRLSRRASHVKGERFEGFAKPSLKGSFGPTERVVVRRALRASGNSLVPVYELSGISGHFYEVELLQVG